MSIHQLSSDWGLTPSAPLNALQSKNCNYRTEAVKSPGHGKFASFNALVKVMGR